MRRGRRAESTVVESGSGLRAGVGPAAALRRRRGGAARGAGGLRAGRPVGSRPGIRPRARRARSPPPARHRGPRGDRARAREAHRAHLAQGQDRRAAVRAPPRRGRHPSRRRPRLDTRGSRACRPVHFPRGRTWTDATDSWSQLAILGPRCRDAAAAAGLPVPDPHGAAAGTLAGIPAQVLGEDGFSSDGLSVVLPAARAAAGWEALSRAVVEAGGRAAGDEAVEAWRVLRGWPADGHELTEEHNPLEAGLRDAVSFTKGCYVGQEVVARLQSRDKVARSLAGFVLPAAAGAPPSGTPIILEDRRRRDGHLLARPSRASRSRRDRVLEARRARRRAAPDRRRRRDRRPSPLRRHPLTPGRENLDRPRTNPRRQCPRRRGPLHGRAKGRARWR